MNTFEQRKENEGYNPLYWVGYYAALEDIMYEECMSEADHSSNPSFDAGYINGARRDRNVKFGKIRY